jgi:hypothetical protein
MICFNWINSIEFYIDVKILFTNHLWRREKKMLEIEFFKSRH